MLLTIVSVIYVLVAVAMIVLILMQRGSGAAAGSGFGGGASATVFGARGSSNFLSTSTKWLAVVFMAMSLGMAWNASRTVDAPLVEEDVGVMSETPAAPPATTAPAGEMPVIPSAPSEPAAPADTAPVDAAPATGDGAESPAPAAADETETAEQGSQED